MNVMNRSIRFKACTFTVALLLLVCFAAKVVILQFQLPSKGADNIVILEETSRRALTITSNSSSSVATLPVTAFQKWTNPFPCYVDHEGLIFIKVKPFPPRHAS